MSPKDFCNWINGVLMMSETDDGGIHITKLQYDKIKTRLANALEPEPRKSDPTRSGGVRHRPNRDRRMKC